MVTRQDIEGWYRSYGPMVLRRCRGLLGSDELAQDAMQDVFVSVLRREGRLDGEAPAGLLYRAATNVCLNRIRDGKVRRESTDGDLLGRIACTRDAEAGWAARHLLDRLFDSGPASTRVMATLHLIDGMTLDEVASEVGLSVSGVRKRLRGLREQLVELASL